MTLGICHLACKILVPPSSNLRACSASISSVKDASKSGCSRSLYEVSDTASKCVIANAIKGYTTRYKGKIMFVSMDLNVVHIRCAVVGMSQSTSTYSLTGDNDELPYAATISIVNLSFLAHRRSLNLRDIFRFSNFRCQQSPADFLPRSLCSKTYTPRVWVIVFNLRVWYRLPVPLPAIVHQVRGPTHRTTICTDVSQFRVQTNESNLYWRGPSLWECPLCWEARVCTMTPVKDSITKLLPFARLQRSSSEIMQNQKSKSCARTFFTNCLHVVATSRYAHIPLHNRLIQ